MVVSVVGVATVHVVGRKMKLKTKAMPCQPMKLKTTMMTKKMMKETEVEKMSAR